MGKIGVLLSQRLQEANGYLQVLLLTFFPFIPCPFPASLRAHAASAGSTCIPIAVPECVAIGCRAGKAPMLTVCSFLAGLMHTFVWDGFTRTSL